MSIIHSQIIESVEQANGSFNVVERHTSSDGRLFDVVYNAPAEMNQEAVLAARASRITAELNAQQQITDAAQAGAPPLHNVTFMLRFTMEERIAIRAARLTNPVVDDFFDLLNMADGVYPTHETTQAGLGYLVSVGLLTAERAAVIGSD